MLSLYRKAHTTWTSCSAIQMTRLPSNQQERLSLLTYVGGLLARTTRTCRFLSWRSTDSGRHLANTNWQKVQSDCVLIMICALLLSYQ